MATVDAQSGPANEPGPCVLGLSRPDGDSNVNDPAFPPSRQLPSAAPAGPRHTMLAELGRGGMATAYLAAVQGPAGFNKLIVVKRLRPALAEEPEFLRMFMEEARLSARIDHPNVVHTNEVGFDGEYHYISMEYLDGQSLESVLRRVLKNSQALKGGDGPPPSDPSGIGIEEAFPLKFHLLVLMHCLQGLDFAHELKDFDGSPLNVVHRDVSPHNIMVTYDGAVKVLDFGIAKAADSSGDTRTGVMKGKCAYMPAEQFGGKSVDRRADIFAVGVMMWQAITNKKMWRGLSDAEIFQRLATGQIPTVSSVKPDVDPALEAICMKALAATPDGRYATCVEFQTAIEDYVAAHPSLRASTRELGKYVSDLFSEDRTRIRGIIEAQLGKEGKGASSKRATSLPQLAIGGGTPTNASASFEINIPTGTDSIAAPQSVSSVAPPAAPKSKMALYGAIAAAAVVAIAAAAILGNRKAGPTVSTEPPPTAAPPPSAAPAGDAMSAITITVKPAEAKVYFDDALLGSSPASGTFKRDGAKHRLRVEAAGYNPHNEWVVLDSGKLSLDVSLEREAPGKKPAPVWYPPHATAPAASGAQVATAAPPPPPTPATTPATTPTKKPGLDTGDPWAPPKK